MTDIRRDFRELRGTDGYLLEFVELGSEIRVDRLRRERYGLVGEMTVTCALPGVKTPGGVLFVGDINLSKHDDRPKLGRILDERSQAPGWGDLLEEFCQRVIRAEAKGRPAVLLRDLNRPEPGEDMDIDGGLRLLRRHPVVLFGDGGDAKSYIALYLATRLAGRGLRVLYADWEFAGEDHRDRLERITGEDMPELWYVRCERPMTAEAERLRRIVREEAIDYIVCDSVAFACDGPPEAAEVAGRYFRDVRSLGVGSLHVAHITKGENGDAKPFGSTFWHNGSRASWYVKRSTASADGTQIAIGLYNRKANTGPLAAAVGYSIAFDEDRTTFRRIAVADVADLADRLTVRERMIAILRGGSRTMAEIAEELDVPVDTVKKTTKRGEGQTFVRVPGEDGVYRIGLALRGVA